MQWEPVPGGDVRTYAATVLANDVAWLRRQSSEPLVLGLCGCQGSGKSTAAAALRTALVNAHGLSAIDISLDDFYLSGAQRQRLAQDIHPLLRTRGVPGTHDVARGIDVIHRLTNASDDAVTEVPRFDKARDEPCPQADWTRFRGRADVVIFEGWCVGARPQAPAALEPPINDMERRQDPTGTWRRFVNAQLAGPYQKLFDLIDCLVLLAAPGFDVVFDWRREQERALNLRQPPHPGSTDVKPMDDEALRRFIVHYERLTRHILAEMPARADLAMRLDEKRNITGLAGDVFA